MAAPASSKTEFMFIDSQATGEIREYLKKNLKPLVNDKFEEFVPLISANIEKICQCMLNTLNKAASKGEFFVNAYFVDVPDKSHIFHLDENAHKLITAIFLRLIPVRHTTITAYGCFGSHKNSWLPEVLPTGKSGYVDLHWTPKYLEDVLRKKKRYKYTPGSTLFMPLQRAKDKDQTDIVFHSKDGGQFDAHSLVLKLNCEFFKKMLDGNFKESESKNIYLDCSLQTLTFLLQFIYEGQITLPPDIELFPILDLFEYSHQIIFNQSPANTPLFDHCIDIINDYLIAHSELSPELIIRLIYCGSLYDNELLIPALKAAEKLEHENKIQWDLIPVSMYTKLLISATKLSLSKVGEELASEINKRLIE